MPMTSDSFMQSVLDSVDDAFKKGAGEVPIAEQAAKGMRAYWESRFKEHEAAIRERWSKDGPTALGKVQEIGALAARNVTEAAKATPGKTSIEYAEFEAAHKEVTQANISEWC